MNRFYREGFIADDTLDLTPLGSILSLEGEVGCLGRIVIRVEKVLEFVDASDHIQTRYYAYNASVQGVGNIFRYDNQHPEAMYEGHRDPHHKHLFNFLTNEEESDSPIWVGAEKWPTLGQVIEELRDWHSRHYGELPFPDQFPSHLQNRF